MKIGQDVLTNTVTREVYEDLTLISYGTLSIIKNIEYYYGS